LEKFRWNPKKLQKIVDNIDDEKFSHKNIRILYEKKIRREL